jgi:hypothetical protein
VKAHADEASRATAATNFIVELCTDEGNNTRSFCDADSGDEVGEHDGCDIFVLTHVMRPRTSSKKIEAFACYEVPMHRSRIQSFCRNTNAYVVQYRYVWKKVVCPTIAICSTLLGMITSRCKIQLIRLPWV